KVVAFRLNYVNSKIAAITAQNAPSPSSEQATPARVAPSPGTNDFQAQLVASTEQLRQAQADKAVLEAKLKEALALRPAEADPQELARANDKIKALQKENELLKITVENEKAKLVSPAATPVPDSTQQALAQAKRELAQEKEINSKLTLEKQALSQQLSQVASKPATAPAPAPEETARLRQVERERALLEKQLQEANRELDSRKAKPRARQVKELESQVADLQVRLDALEAKKVPYSAEELALFKAPAAQLSSAEAAQPKVSREFPAGSATLVAQAQRYFAEQDFDKAEATYRQVLKLDEKNVPALANLAAIQVEAKHFEAAEGTLHDALGAGANDGYTLYVLGLLKFRQSKYDEALDALSRAAKLDPKNAEVQNYLGLTLSEKGLRGPAEAALRKAIELQPNYAGAHYNLALFYLTQQPKYPALARWHYQKALSAGFPRSADLEKLLEEKQ
ncbi:MAG TPA: tetratricopeptide repeat protein, partial [Verrucomicrobiae bacterium]|nr:tetratricopeptide repeat protein [Verrucomicrobiae bacterium]